MATTGSLSSVTSGAAVVVKPGMFSVKISGTFVATVRLEKSIDNGVTWDPHMIPVATALSWTAPMSINLEEGERCLYRMNMTARTSGTADWRIGQDK